MDHDELVTRLTYLEKATNQLAEGMVKNGKHNTGSRGPAPASKARIPSGAIRIKLPAYDVKYQGTMRRVDVAAMQDDPELHAHMRGMYPEIFED